MIEYPPELQVAPPREGNSATCDENSAFGSDQTGNHDATTDLKAIAINRLNKIRGNQHGNQSETDELHSRQLSPVVEATEVACPEEGSGSVDWLQWIAGQLPLLREDREYIWARLATLPPQAMEKTARRYVQTWTDAANTEPKSHRKENAGRCAANRTLLALVRPGNWRKCHGRHRL